MNFDGYREKLKKIYFFSIKKQFLLNNKKINFTKVERI